MKFISLLLNYYKINKLKSNDRRQKKQNTKTGDY